MEPWADELVRNLRAKNIALAPTLTLWEWEAERAGASRTVLEKFIGTAQQQLRAYARAGGEILFGTDLGYVTDYDTTDEYVLMSGAGMTFQQILAALTVTPAKRFGLANYTGRIAVGMDADIVILNGDPAVDIKAFSNIRFTLRKGKFV